MDAGYARFRRKLTYSEVFFRKRFDAKYLHQVSKPFCCITLEPVSLTLRRSVLGSRVIDTKTVPGDTGYALPISRIHLIGYLVEDGITSSVHAKHTFSRTSIMLRISRPPCRFAEVSELFSMEQEKAANRYPII